MTNSQDLDITTLKQMLEEISQLAESSSLTGALQAGSSRLAKHYNFVLSHLQEKGLGQANIFTPLDEDRADFGTIAVESHMLHSTIAVRNKDKKKSGGDGADWLCAIAPFLDSKDLALLIDEKLDEGMWVPDEMLPALAPFVGSEALARIVRNRLAKPKPEPAPEPRQESPLAVVPEVSPTQKMRSDSAEELQNILSRLAQSGLGSEDRDRVESTIAKVLRELGSRI